MSYILWFFAGAVLGAGGSSYFWWSHMAPLKSQLENMKAVANATVEMAKGAIK